jgi:hypothetical protein
MNRDFVERALAQAERHVAEGKVILARQRASIVASELIGGDVARFKKLLSVFEDSQRVHVADRDRLRKDLENAWGPKGEKRAADVNGDAVKVRRVAAGKETESAGQRGASRL